MNMVTNNKKIRTVFLPSFFIAVGVLMGFREMLTPSPLNLFVSVLCSIMGIVLSRVLKSEHNRNQLVRFLSLVIFAWAFNVMSVFVQGGLNALRLATLAYMIFTVFVTFVMIKCDLNLMPFKAVFYYISFFFAYKIFVIGDNPDEILVTSAGGMMVTILMAIAIPTQLLDYRRLKKVSLTPPIVIFVIAIFSVSRTAMFCAAFYLLIVMGVIAFQSSQKRVWGYVFFAVIILIMSYIIISHWDEIMALEMYEKFETRGVNVSGRDDIWKLYIGQMNLFHLVFGMNVDKVHQIAGYANTHNSYIQLHSQIGILAFVYILLYLRVCVYYMRKSFVSFLLLLVLIIRGFFDTPFFFGIFDFALFLFIVDYKEQTKRISKEQRVSVRLL